MVRHDQIGDLRVSLAKSVGTAISGDTYSSVVKAGDHKVLVLTTQHYSATGTKDYTVVLEESSDNSTFTAIAGASFTRSATSAEDGEDMIIVERRKVGRYVRAKFTTATSAFSVAAVWILYGDKVQNIKTRTNILVA